LVALALSIIAALALARLEPFLPEYDGWWHLIFGEKVKEVGSTNYGGPWSNFRPFFLHWMVNLEFLSGINSFTLTKWVIPAWGVFASVLSLRVYAGENDRIQRKSLLFLLLIIPFVAPLFLSQIIYVRAQYPVMMTAFYFLFLAKRRHPFFNLLGLVLVLLSIMFHEFSLFYLPLFLIVTIRYWPAIRERWRSVVPHLIYLSLLAFAYRGVFWGAILRPFQTAAPFLERLREQGLALNPNLFFWKDYIGSDRPYQFTNYELLKFYAHHFLILVSPLIGLWLLIRFFYLRKEGRGDLAFRYALFGTLFLLFFIVEGLPRLGVPMDPERPWSFINYFVLAIIADLVVTIRWKRSALRLASAGILAIALLSIGVTGSFIREREKRIYATDIPAMEFIRDKTPATSLIIVPFDKRVPLAFFTGRAVTAAPRLSLWDQGGGRISASQKTLATLSDNFNEARVARVRTLREEIDRSLETLLDADPSRVARLLNEYGEALRGLPKSVQPRDIYLLVSQSPRDAAWIEDYASGQDRYEKETIIVKESGLFEVTFENETNALFRYIGPPRPMLTLEEAESLEQEVQNSLAPIGRAL
jgi:hypothetical protein